MLELIGLRSDPSASGATSATPKPSARASTRRSLAEHLAQERHGFRENAASRVVESLFDRAGQPRLSRRATAERTRFPSSVSEAFHRRASLASSFRATSPSSSSDATVAPIDWGVTRSRARDRRRSLAPTCAGGRARPSATARALDGRLRAQATTSRSRFRVGRSPPSRTAASVLGSRVNVSRQKGKLTSLTSNRTAVFDAARRLDEPHR